MDPVVASKNIKSSTVYFHMILWKTSTFLPIHCRVQKLEYTPSCITRNTTGDAINKLIASDDHIFSCVHLFKNSSPSGNFALNLTGLDWFYSCSCKKICSPFPLLFMWNFAILNTLPILWHCQLPFLLLHMTQ